MHINYKQITACVQSVKFDLRIGKFEGVAHLIVQLIKCPFQAFQLRKLPVRSCGCPPPHPFSQ